MKEACFSEAQEQQILQMFGKSQLRAGQRELIAAALVGRNVLGVLPTGHGKSLCYQAAAVLLGVHLLWCLPLLP